MEPAGKGGSSSGGEGGRVNPFQREVVGQMALKLVKKKLSTEITSAAVSPPAPSAPPAID